MVDIPYVTPNEPGPFRIPSSWIKQHLRSFFLTNRIWRRQKVSHSLIIVPHVRLCLSGLKQDCSAGLAEANCCGVNCLGKGPQDLWAVSRSRRSQCSRREEMNSPGIHVSRRPPSLERGLECSLLRPLEEDPMPDPWALRCYFKPLSLW